MRAHRIGDADAADDRRGQPDQRHEERKAPDRLPEARGGRADAGHPPAPVGVFAREAAVFRNRAARLVQRDAVFVADQASGLHEAGPPEPLPVEHEARPEGEEADGAVRLAFQRGADGEGPVAHLDPVADGEAQPLQQGRLDDGAAVRQRVRQRHAAGKAEGARERIGAVHRLEFDQRRAAAGARHGPHLDHFRNAPEGREIGPRGGVRRHVGGAHGEVAAMQRAGIAGNAGLHRHGDGMDRRNRRDADGDAEEEDAEAGEAAAHFAPRQPPGERGISPQCARPRSAPGVRSAPPGRVVGDEDHGRAAVRGEAEQRVECAAARLAVEIAGRLVGEDRSRGRPEGARNRDPLLLAA